MQQQLYMPPQGPGHSRPKGMSNFQYAQEAGLARQSDPELERQQAEATRRAKEQAAFRDEKNKQSTWTHTKLATLALHGAEKRKNSDKKNPLESQLPPGNNQRDLEHVDAILDKPKYFGDPNVLRSDIDIIAKGLEDEKFIIDGNEMQEVTVPGKKYLFGLLLQKHIFDKKFTVHKNANGKIIVTDTTNSTDPKRLKQKEGLERELGVKSLGFNILDGLEEQVAALAYREHNNLPGYRDDLLRKLGGDKPTLESIQKSNKLSTEEKSFLLSWHDTAKNGDLQNVMKEQEQYVKNAVANVGKKTMEQHWEEGKKRPISKAIELMGAISPLILPGVIIVGALFFILGKDSKIAKFFAVLFGAGVLLTGGKNAVNAAEDLWQGSTNFAKKTGEKTGEVVSNAREWSEKQVNAFVARNSGPEKWTKLIVREDLKPATQDYSVPEMLYVLGDGDRGDYKAYKPDTTTQKKIEETFKKFKTPEEKKSFARMLEVTWKRHKEASPPDHTHIAKEKELKLPAIITSLDLYDGWASYLPDGLVPDWLGSPVKHVEVMKIIGPKAKEWGDLTLGELETYFQPFVAERTEQINAIPPQFAYETLDRKKIDGDPAILNSAIFDNVGENMNIIKLYLQAIGAKNLQDKKTVKLRDFLAKK